MKYTTIFVIMMALVIIICGLGIAFIWQNQNPMRSFVAGTNAYTVGNYEMAINKLSDYLSYGYNNDETEISRYYLAAAINRKREYLSETGGITQNESRLLDKRAKRTYLNVINGNKMNNKYVEAVIGYAEIAQRNGEYDRFITHKLEKVLHRHPESKLEDKIYTYLGYQYLFARDYRKAMNCFLNSSSKLARLGQARTHLQLKQFESAFKIFEDFFDYFPNSVYIERVKSLYLHNVRHYAGLKADGGKQTEAILLYKKIINYFPDSVQAEEARFKIGDAYSALENYKAAQTYYRQAYEDSQEKLNDDALYQIGICHYELGEMTEAYKIFNKLINQYPRSIYLSKAREWVRQLRKELEYFQS